MNNDMNNIPEVHKYKMDFKPVNDGIILSANHEVKSAAADNRAKIQDIRRRLLSAVITYEQAKAEAQPVIDEINARAQIVAKKYKVRTGKVTFPQLMRG